jgi:subtilisin-like proprotein convertase family protein
VSLRALILPAGRRAFAAAASALILPVAALVGAAPASAAVFTNTATITIADEADASPYPSAIEVSGLGGTITDVNVTLTGVSHSYPDDINVLLAGPGGQNVILMSGTGGDPDVSSVTLTFDDSAGPLPDEEQIVSGSYAPTIGATCGSCSFSGGPPAPVAPYGTTLGVFNTTAPNGTWNLFVADDTAEDVGSISGGWSLDIATSGGPTITSFTPASGPPGTSVTIEGTRLGGVTAVTFGGVDAEFSPGTATRLTATVPHGAVTGPIAVTTPEGTATSSTDFTVGAAEHDREVTLRIGSKARGKVSVPDGFSDCASDVPVKVQRRDGGSWRLVGTTQSASGGAYVVAGTDDPGRYRALAKKVTLPSGDVCLKAVSPVVTS